MTISSADCSNTAFCASSAMGAHLSLSATLPVRRPAPGIEPGSRRGLPRHLHLPHQENRIHGRVRRQNRGGDLDQGALHPLLAVGVFVAVFLAIHPFQDGNGRLSRILTTLLLLRAGYEYVPYSSLESVIEQTRDAYYLALRRTQGSRGTGTPDWQPWLRYFLTALKRQKDRLQERIDRERLLFGNLPELSARILEIARDRGRVSVADAVLVTGASRNTLKGHFRTLVEAGHLNRHGAGRGTWYSPA